MIELQTRLPCARCHGPLYYAEQRGGICGHCAEVLDIRRICDRNAPLIRIPRPR